MAASAVATRARILSSARRLLNRRGFGEVTVRSIAAAAKISHGNLCYHYANVARIVEALVEELAAASDAQISAVDFALPPLPLLLELQRVTFALMIEYRFFFVDYVAIVRALPRMRAQLAAIKERRATQFIAFLSSLRALGLIAAEPAPGHDADLFAQYDLIVDFWISHALIVFGGATEAASKRYQELAFALLIPHLTDEGRRQWRALK